MAKKSNIEIWNASIDNTKTVQRIGRNGVHYEYLIPLASDPFHYYQDAEDVRSRKSPTTKYNNGKRPGQYQPVGDKSYFTFYEHKQYRKLRKAMMDIIYILEAK